MNENSKPFVCHQCWGSRQVLTLYVLAAVAMLVLAKVLCHFTLSQDRAPAGLGSFAAPPGQTTQRRACLTDVAKVFLFCLQCLWILAGMFGVEWPTSLSGPFRALLWLFSSSTPRALGIDCILREREGLPIASQVFVLSMLMPLGIMLVLLAYETVATIIKLARRRRPIATAAAELHKLVAQAIIVLSIFLPQLLRAVFGLFACVQLDVPVSAPYEAAAVGSFWVNQMSQQCWQGYHRRLALGAGVPLVLLLCVVLPMSVLVCLIRCRTRLYSASLRHYSFLYSMYTPSAFWWEVVVILKLSVLVAIAVFAVRLGTYYGCVVLTAAYFVVLGLLVWRHPYSDPIAGVIATRGALCVLLTSFSTLLFMPPGTITIQSAAYELYADAVGAVVLVANVAFVLSVVWHAVPMIRISLLWKRVVQKVAAVFGKVKWLKHSSKGPLKGGVLPGLPPAESVSPSGPIESAAAGV